MARSKRAPIRISFNALGDKKLARALRKLPQKVERKYAMKAMRTGWKIIHRGAKAKVPVASGRLKRSMKLRTRRRTRARGGGHWVGLRVFTGTREALNIQPTQRVGLYGGKGVGYYPMALEAGYTRQDGVKVPERSYLRSVLNRNRARVRRKVRVTLWRQIRAGAKSA